MNRGSPDPGERAGAETRRESPLRPLDLLAALHAHDVEFIVIGGFSLAAHGYVRGTKDLDVVPEPSEANLRRLMAALHEIEAEPPAIGDFKPAEMLLELDVEGLKQGGNWLLPTRLGHLDVMQYVPGMQSYEKLREQTIVPVIPGLAAEVHFAGRDDLIAMKRAAGRDQDLTDIAELERARGASAG